MKEVLELGDLEQAVRLIFEEKVPFNRLLGVKVEGIDEESVRMELHNDENNLIAVGTGAYTVT